MQTSPSLLGQHATPLLAEANDAVVAIVTVLTLLCIIATACAFVRVCRLASSAPRAPPPRPPSAWEAKWMGAVSDERGEAARRVHARRVGQHKGADVLPKDHAATTTATAAAQAQLYRDALIAKLDLISASIAALPPLPP